MTENEMNKKFKNYLDFKDVLRERLLMGIKVVFDKENPPHSGCWEWQEGVTNKGYGSFKLYYHTYSTHIVSAYCYGLINNINDIVIGKRQVLHKCDNTICVNPSHLYIGTQRDNMMDAMKRGRWR